MLDAMNTQSDNDFSIVMTQFTAYATGILMGDLCRRMAEQQDGDLEGVVKEVMDTFERGMKAQMAENLKEYRSMREESVIFKLLGAPDAEDIMLRHNKAIKKFREIMDPILAGREN